MYFQDCLDSGMVLTGWKNSGSRTVLLQKDKSKGNTLQAIIDVLYVYS